METRNLEVIVTANTTKFKEQMNGATGAINEGGNSIMSMAKGFIVAQVAMEAINKGVELLKESFTEANKVNNEINASMAQLTQLITDTGGASGQTAESIAKMSEELSKSVPISKEANLAAAQMIIPYTNIGKNIFPQVLTAADDLATHMNHGLAPSTDQVSGAAKSLAMALNDPAAGMGRLRKVGIALTLDQQNQIKTVEKQNGIYAAQQVLMDIVSKTMGGSAKAAAETWNGKMTILKNTFVDFEANGIQKVKEGLNSLVNSINNFINSEGFQKWLNGVINAAKEFWNFLQGIFAPAFKALGNTIANDLMPSLMKLWNALNPTLLEALKIVGAAIGITLIAVLRVLVDAINFVARAISDLIDWISNIINWFKRFVDGISQAINWINTLASRIWNAVVNGLSGIGGWLWQAGRDLIQGLINGIGSMINSVGDSIKNVAQSAVNKVKSFLGIHSPSTVFMQIGQNMGQGLINGIASMQDAAQQATTDLAKTSISGAGSVVNNTSNQSINVNVNTGNLYGMPQTAGADLGNSLVNQLRLASRGF